MENNREHILPHEFEAYLSGRMSAEEKAAFELRVENDPFAKEALEGFLLLENNAKATALINDQITAIETKTGYKPEKKGIKISLFKVLSIAASLIIVIGGLFITRNFLQDKNSGLSEAKTEDNAEDLYFESRGRKEFSFDADSEILEESSEVVSIFETPKETPKQDKKEEKPISADILKKESAEKILSETPSQVQENVFSDLAATSRTESMGSAKSAPASAAAKEYEDDLSVSQSNFDKGYAVFEKGNFNESIKYFSESIKENKKVIESYYYSGLSYYYQNKYNNAIKAFDIVINDSYHVLANNAKWYKADIYIKQGRKQDARTILQELIDSNSYFKKQAEEAIKKL